MEIKFFKKEKSFKKKNLQFNPNLYWIWLVCSFFLAAFLALVFGFYLFIQVNKENLAVSDGDTIVVEKIKKERIIQVLEYFSKREKKSNQIINSPSPIMDPSL